MKFRNWTFCAALAMGCLPGTLWAANTVLSGIFDGSETRIAPLPGPGTCNTNENLAYEVVSPLQVTASGAYFVVDAFDQGNVDVLVLIYAGSFNPNSPQTNLVTPVGIDTDGEVNLISGTNYEMVVQNCARNFEGAWAVTFSGMGNVNSDRVVSVPSMTEGVFDGSEPTVDTECGNTSYKQFGPIRVSRRGMYHFMDIFEFNLGLPTAVDVCLHIYSEPLDPGNPDLNRVGFLDWRNDIELESDTDYYFVTQPWSITPTGEYFFVLAPPAPFRITHAMAGGWFEPATAGQGFLMDVFDNANSLFLAWFTYDLERPGSGAEAMIGDPGHRWLTAQGPFSGDTAELDVYWTAGMIFDSGTPPFSQEQDGNMTVEFFDCQSGRVTYDLGTAGVQGQVPIQRLANDAVELCQSLYAGPDRPGPL